MASAVDFQPQAVGPGAAQSGVLLLAPSSGPAKADGAGALEGVGVDIKLIVVLNSFQLVHANCMGLLGDPRGCREAQLHCWGYLFNSRAIAKLIMMAAKPLGFLDLVHVVACDF